VSSAVTITMMNDIRMVDDLESLFRAHHGRLVRALTVACGNEQIAADAVQVAFVKAHLKWRSIMSYDDPVGWIRRVAINNMRDEHRRESRKQRVVDRLGAEPEVQVQAPQLDEVATMLAGLPRKQRLSLALFYVDGLSVAETAATLGISEGAVKFHLHQGRSTLRGQLGEGVHHE